MILLFFAIAAEPLYLRLQDFIYSVLDLKQHRVPFAPSEPTEC
ncbi:MAG: hypothetical protein ACI9WM_001241 [Arenicella sp.]